jgi:DNA polymerase III subunit gamma/tau
MYQVIARKYRPQTFSELVNQVHVRTTLENAITQNRIAHGYIFSGQRGTGKTTVARILARCLNCVEGPTTTPCGKCASCLEITGGNTVDVIEIDAASNRGINEMRELRENVRYRPARDRYKVFIVDEAHQITSEAFNALLKTLEEPPEWVVFILCTTESHKIPATIASRCQQFSFRSVAFEEIVTRMAWICEQEGIQAEPEALAVLAQVGEGSVRDSLSALDQAIACCGGELKAAEVRGLVGAFSLDSLHQVTQALSESNSTRMLEVVDELVRNGHHLQHFCRELARYFRNLLVARIAGKDTRLIATSPHERERLAEIAASFSEEDLTRYLQLTLELFRDMQFSLQPRLHLEIGLVRLVHAGKIVTLEQAIADLGRTGGDSTPPAPKASGGGVQQRTAPAATSTRTAAPGNPPAAPKAVAPAGGSWNHRLHAALTELNMKMTADAVEHAEIRESCTQLQFVVPAEYALFLQADDVNKALRHLGERPRKIVVSAGNPASTGGSPMPAKKEDDDEVTRRALAHPEVQKFREVFDGAEIRAVRNLKE